MTIFVGAFQNGDLFHRVATILGVTVIVITAVYILRVVGMMLMGPVKKKNIKHYQRSLGTKELGYYCY